MGTKTIILTAGIHGDEPDGLAVAQRIKALCAGDTRVTVIYHGMINPTGFDRGTRENSDGVDLNREWTSEGNRTGSPKCAAVWSDILAARDAGSTDDVLVIDCHSIAGTPGVFYAGELGRVAAESCFRYVARIDAWTTAGTLASACEAAGVRAVAVEVSKGESCRAIAEAVYQAINTWAAYGPAGKLRAA